MSSRVQHNGCTRVDIPPGHHRTAAQEAESIGRLFYCSPENMEASTVLFSLSSLIAPENSPSFLMWTAHWTKPLMNQTGGLAWNFGTRPRQHYARAPAMGDSTVVDNCYNSNISLTYCGRPVGLRMSNSMRWMRRFALLDTLHPTRPSVPMFSFLLWLKYFSDIPRTSGRTPDVRLCAMATAFFHYRTTCA